MGWRIFTKEADGVIGKSSEIASEATALGFAGDMIRDGIEVLRIEAPDGFVINAEAIAACRAEQTRSRS